MVTWLAARGADASAADAASSVTALMVAAKEVQTAVVRALLARGADRARKTPDGQTVASLAERWGKPHIARRLAR
jgi:ankyrin repeat protein